MSKMFKRFVSTFTTVSLLTTLLLVNVPIAYAAAISWDGGGVDNDWCTKENWDGDTLPTDADDVTIDANVTVLMTECGVDEVDFSTLTLGGTNSVIFGVSADFGTAGSIIVADGGILAPHFFGTINLSGDLTVLDGGVVSHTSNSSAYTYKTDISADNIDVQLGGVIDANERGFSAVDSSTGLGPAGGVGTTSSTTTTGGGGHGGNGGDSARAGGDATNYTDVLDDVSTMGSAGGSGDGTLGGDGGGLIILTAASTIDVDGTIRADGQTAPSAYGGGGAGGGIKLSAASFTGTGTISAAGGNATGGGGGGGGIASIEYTGGTTFSGIFDFDGGMSSGSGKDGGAGYVHWFGTGLSGHLFVGGANNADGTYTPLPSDAMSFQSVDVNTNGVLFVDNGQTLTLESENAWQSTDPDGEIEVEGTLELELADNVNDLVLDIGDGGLLDVQNSTYFSNAACSGCGLYLRDGSTIQMSDDSNAIETYSVGDGSILLLDEGATFSIQDLEIEDGAEVILSNYGTAEELSLDTLTINDGGTLTHSQNTDGNVTHTVNVTATTIDIISGGEVNVDGKGHPTFEAGSCHGYGTGGQGVSFGGGAGTCGSSVTAAGGGGHVGAGGTWVLGGGNAIANPSLDLEIVTMGGAGGSTDNGSGGYGGGLVKLNTSGTLTLDGTITANGADGPNGLTGGGAGGGVWLIANEIDSTTGAISVDGGDGNGSAGGGGGGGILIGYSTANDIGVGDVTAAAGSAGTPGLGAFHVYTTNTAPTISTALSAGSFLTDGSSHYTFTFSVDDDDDDDVDVKVACGDGDYAHNLDVPVSNSIPAGAFIEGSEYQITGLDTSSGPVDVEMTVLTSTFLDDTDTSDFQCEVTPYDGTSSGTASAVTGLSIDNLDPDPNADASFVLVNDADENGIANIGDTFMLVAGTENTGDTVIWAVDLTGITSDGIILAGVESTPIIAGNFVQIEDTPTNITVLDDAGNEVDGPYATTVPEVDNEPPRVGTPSASMTLQTDSDASGTISSGDTIRVFWDNTIDGNDDEETVTANLSNLNLSNSVTLYDDGTNGDTAAGDDIYTSTLSIPEDTASTYEDTFSISVVDDANNSNSANSASYTVVFYETEEESNNNSGGGDGGRDNPLTSDDNDGGDDSEDEDTGGEEEQQDEDEENDDEQQEEDQDDQEDVEDEQAGEEENDDEQYDDDEQNYEDDESDEDSSDDDSEIETTESSNTEVSYRGSASTSSSDNSERVKVVVLEEPDEDAVEVPVIEKEKLTPQDPLFTNTGDETQFGVFGMSVDRALCTGQKVVVTGKIKGNEIGCRITQSSNTFTQRQIDIDGPLDCSEHVVLDETGTFLLETSQLDQGNNVVQIFTRKEVANFDICVEEVGVPNPLSLAHISIADSTNFAKVGDNHYKLVDKVNLDDPGKLNAVAALKDAIVGDEFHVQGIWNSLIMSSVVLADSHADRVTLYPPEPLSEGSHTLYLKTVNTVTNKTSDTIRLDFELDYLKGSADENPFAMNTIYVGLIAIAASLAGYFVYRRKYYSA